MKTLSNLCLLTVAAFFVLPISAEEVDNIGHERHRFKHGDNLAVEPPSESRFTTSRKSDVALNLPKDDPSFTFVVLGDRTSGQDSHVSVLADAVHEINLLEPDMVLCVGDMVQGYNTTEPWLRQMKEYKDIMNELKSPWFPTVGNHDVYWGGPDRPKYQNEGNYEIHFGPLWYAFEHKNCWFVVLFTDEGDRETGDKNFSKPELQKMTEEQFQWLKSTLEKAKGAEHVFVFQHQPRWQNKASYGDDWDRIHKLFVELGNVSAVFAGHTHTMRYENRDGIEYFTLSTTGGRFNQAGVPKIGYQDNYLILNIRKGRFGVISVPVHKSVDPRELTPELTGSVRNLQNALRNGATKSAISVGADGKVDAKTVFALENPVPAPIRVEVGLTSRDARWQFTSYAQKAVLQPGEKKEFELAIKRDDHSIDAGFCPPFVNVDVTVLTPGMEIPVPSAEVLIPMELKTHMEKRRTAEQAVLRLGVPEDRLESPSVALHTGKPFTVELWFNAASVAGSQTLLAKGRDRHELALFFIDGNVRFKLPWSEGGNVTLKAPEEVKVSPKHWHHVAGVGDGKEIRLYLDGKLVDKKEATKKLPNNNHPTVLGVSLTADNIVRYGFLGDIDSVRLSTSARYADPFEPQRDPSEDKNTVLLLDMQESVGKQLPTTKKPWFYGRLEGDAKIVLESTLP